VKEKQRWQVDNNDYTNQKGDLMWYLNIVALSIYCATLILIQK
jgi:hypothetical protein